MTAAVQATMSDVFVDETEIRTPCDGSLPAPVRREVADDDEWDLIDLELRAEESAFQDAYERGLIFA